MMSFFPLRGEAKEVPMNIINKPLRKETLLIHGGHTPDRETGARAVPIYQTTSYQFKNSEHAANLFALNEFGNIYTRLMNPTTDVLEKRVTAMEGGIGALATASGQAAISLALLNIARAGDEIVSTENLYGGTYTLFKYIFKRFGITVRFVPANDMEALNQAVNDRTKAVYTESIGNPGLNAADIETMAGIGNLAFTDAAALRKRLACGPVFGEPSGSGVGQLSRPGFQPGKRTGRKVLT
jgi:O-acetylhomoserine (thiol)-lyase